MPFAATWMGLEMVILSEGSQTEKEEYCMASLTWNLKRNCMNEIIYKKDSQRTNLWLLARGGGVWRMGGRDNNRESGLNMYTWLCLKWITNKDLPYGTCNSA